MPLYLARLLNRLKRRVSWMLPLQVFIFVFVTSWPLMALAEPGSDMVRADTYYYYFIVTTATVGYGDFTPTTPWGYLVSIYIIVGGVATISALFARIAQAIGEAKGIRMKGLHELKLTDHFVVLGYFPGRTEAMVERLLAEENRAIAVCAWEDQATEHPLEHMEDVHFVRGNLTDDDVLQRAALSQAAAVLVDARDDDEALKVVVAANYHNPDVHTVVALQDLAHTRTVFRVAENAWCVQWHSPDIITEELQDPGMSRLYDEMMRLSDRNTYALRVPETLPDRTFGEFQQALGRWNAATILAVRTDDGMQLSPSWQDEVPVGSVLYVLARRRLETSDLERFVDSAEKMLVSTETELLRGEWHG